MYKVLKIFRIFNVKSHSTAGVHFVHVKLSWRLAVESLGGDIFQIKVYTQFICEHCIICYMASKGYLQHLRRSLNQEVWDATIGRQHQEMGVKHSYSVVILNKDTQLVVRFIDWQIYEYICEYPASTGGYICVLKSMCVQHFNFTDSFIYFIVV